MIGLLILGIIVVIVGLYMTQTNKGSKGDPNYRLGGKIASIIGVLIIVIGIIAGSFTGVYR